MVYYTPAQKIQAQRAQLVAGVRSINDATHRLAEMGADDMREQSQGPLKSKTLAAMGHPYAKRGAKVTGAARGITSKRKFQSSLKGQIKKSGMVQRLPINKQSGRLHRGIVNKRTPGNRISYSVYSSAPHAKYALKVGGTKYVVDRGLKGPKGLMRKRWLLRRHVVVDHIRRAHRLGFS